MENHENQVLDALFKRRSIRKYTDEAVAPDDIRTILEAGRWAPSGLNNQPWRFLVIFKGDERQSRLEQCTKYGHIIREANVLICVFLRKDAIYSEMKDHQGAGACIQNMLLATHALGLGAVWIGQIVNDQPKVMSALGLAEDELELQAVLAVGHPGQEGSSRRKPLQTLMLEDF